MGRNMAVKTMSSLLSASSRLRPSSSMTMMDHGTSDCNLFGRTLLRRVNHPGWISATTRHCAFFSSTVSPSLSSGGLNSKSSDEGVEEMRVSDVAIDDDNSENTQPTHNTASNSTLTPTEEKKEQRMTNLPGAQTGGGRKLAIIYICGVCETRSIKQFTENAYLNGVVLVRCPGCQSLHLIADRLGYFSDPDDGDNNGMGFDVAKALDKKGGNVKSLISEQDVMELTLE